MQIKKKKLNDCIQQKDVLLGGDFNADCDYVCSTCWNEIDLWTDQRFSWLIPSSFDTNVGSNSCAYDR